MPRTTRSPMQVSALSPAGYQGISAARNGYTKQEYGQRVSKGRGTVITVVKGQVMKDIVFSLTPAGYVNGTVRDISGEPLTGFQVFLLRSFYNPTRGRSFLPRTSNGVAAVCGRVTLR